MPHAQPSLLGLRPSAPYLGGLALAGLVMVLYFHHWEASVTAVCLVLAWWAILATGYFLWTAGLLVAAEGDDSEGFHLGRSRRDDLHLEKHSLLKAIKEVEFDHQMGKMSDADASALTALYRTRAVEILKELDQVAEGDETLTIAERIERDIRARAEISGARDKARARARAEKTKKSKVKAKAAPAPEPTPESTKPMNEEEEE